MEKRCITLREAAKKMKINKSTLHYYLSRNLLEPSWEASRVFFFEEDYLLERIKKIKSFQKDGLSLTEIKQKIKKN